MNNNSIKNESNRIKILKKKIKTMSILKNISDDLGEPFHNEDWLLKHMMGLTDNEIEESINFKNKKNPE